MKKIGKIIKRNIEQHHHRLLSSSLTTSSNSSSNGGSGMNGSKVMSSSSNTLDGDSDSDEDDLVRWQWSVPVAVPGTGSVCHPFLPAVLPSSGVTCQCARERASKRVANQRANSSRILK